MFGGIARRLPGLFGQGAKATHRKDTTRDDSPVRWVVVLETLSMVEARIAAARLEDEGIPTHIRQEAASSAIPVSVGILGRIDVLVPEPHAEQALLILQMHLPIDDEGADEELPPDDGDE